MPDVIIKWNILKMYMLMLMMDGNGALLQSGYVNY